MTNETQVRVMNTITGQIQMIRASLANHPIFGVALVEVQDEVKPYAVELHVEQTPEDFRDTHPNKVVWDLEGEDYTVNEVED